MTTQPSAERVWDLIEQVCVLRIEPITAELWDGPASKAVALYEIAKARLTGSNPNLGENRKMTVGL